MQDPRVKGLLNQTALRIRLEAVCLRFGRLGLALTLLWVVALLASRLLALLPDLFLPSTVLVPPSVAALIAVLWARRPTHRDAARRLDRATGSHDLFLTATMAQTRDGQYEPLVQQAAAAAGATLRPARLVPLPWRRPLARLTPLLFAALLLGLYLPQYDPFGLLEAQRDLQKRQRLLAETRKATGMRVNRLKEALADTRQANPVKLRLDTLVQDLQRMQKERRQANLDRLKPHQQDLGRMWRKITQKKLADAFSRRPAAQRFGGQFQKAEQWRKQVQKGDFSGLRKAMQKLREQAKRLATMPESAAKRKLQQAMQQDLKALRDLAASQLNNRPMAQTLEQAMEQLAMAGSKGLNQEALQALQQSLDLSELEMQQLAQNLQDLKSLEDALKTLQMAQQLNQLKQLDGTGSQDCKTLADYAALYQKLLAQAKPGAGEGAGPGMKGKGTGKGGKAPEDDTVDTDYASQRSKSALTAGKILLQWKTRGLSDPGQAREAYLDHVDEIKQGASEAILQEDVPPAYHDAIKTYFNTIKPGLPKNGE